MTRVVWHGAEAKAKARAGAVSGLQKWVDDVALSSKAEVPVADADGGFTRDSQQVSVDEASLRAAVSYSGPGDKPKLPIWVHEGMSAHHPTGKAKFLEDPLNASKNSGPETVRAEVKKALG